MPCIDLLFHIARASYSLSYLYPSEAVIDCFLACDAYIIMCNLNSRLCAPRLCFSEPFRYLLILYRRCNPRCYFKNLARKKKKKKKNSFFQTIKDCRYSYRTIYLER